MLYDEAAINGLEFHASGRLRKGTEISKQECFFERTMVGRVREVYLFEAFVGDRVVVHCVGVEIGSQCSRLIGVSGSMCR